MSSFKMLRVFGTAMLVLALSLFGVDWSRAQVRPTANDLAVLVAIPDVGEWSEAAGNDQDVMEKTLLKKGLPSERIMKLRGRIAKTALLEFLRDAAERTKDWKDGSVFVHFSCSGHHENRQKAGIELPGQDPKFATWAEILATLKVPVGVRVILVPDCCYSNLLDGQLPDHVSALVLKAKPNTTVCTAENRWFAIDGKKTSHGVITHYASQALLESETMDQWLRITTLLSRETHPNLLKVVGDPKRKILAN